MNWKRWFVLSFVGCFCAAINASDPFVIRAVNTTQPVVALTFDDGPGRYTDDILDILKVHQSKASFFLIGSKLRRYQGYVKRIEKEDHTIGNHSYNHHHITVQSHAELLKNIAKSQLIFNDVLGRLPIYFRPPYGEVSLEQETLLKKHFSYLVRWSIDPKDWDKKQDSSAIVNHILMTLKPGVIIVLHERKQTVKLLPELIVAIQQKGYQLVSLDSLLRF
ncbi:hypothetical protein CL657_00325 [bacterium]|nr:hypothetical protein [bacterium]